MGEEVESMGQPVNYSDMGRFAKGVAIIYAAQPDASIAAEHDQIWYGYSEETSEEDRAKLEALGWFESEDSWSFFT